VTQDQLQEFFREKKQRANSSSVDWGAKRDAWIEAVERLYKTVAEDYLARVRADIELSYSEKAVTESYIGAYRIRELNLRVGDEQVLFSPKGTNIIGAQGRIDVSGDRADATIVWQSGDRWSLVLSRTPTLRLIDLNADSFAEMLKGIMRP